jgi:hypothetical protein
MPQPRDREGEQEPWRRSTSRTLPSPRERRRRGGETVELSMDKTRKYLRLLGITYHQNNMFRGLPTLIRKPYLKFKRRLLRKDLG